MSATGTHTHGSNGTATPEPEPLDSPATAAPAAPAVEVEPLDPDAVDFDLLLRLAYRYLPKVDPAEAGRFLATIKRRRAIRSYAGTRQGRAAGQVHRLDTIALPDGFAHWYIRGNLWATDAVACGTPWIEEVSRGQRIGTTPSPAGSAKPCSNWPVAAGPS